MTPIGSVRNLGQTSAQMLEEVGISSVEDLREIGSVAAYRRLKFTFENRVSLNFLWALEAGLRDIDWRDLSAADKSTLKAALHDPE